MMLFLCCNFLKVETVYGLMSCGLVQVLLDTEGVGAYDQVTALYSPL